MDISTSSASPPMPTQGHRLTDEEYARSRHAVWMSAAAVFTDEAGRVLLVKPTYRDEWLLPGGAAEPGESPEQAFTREVHEELGLLRQPVRLLAVHWLSPEHPDVPPAMPFPGEVRHILDGGTLTTQQTDALRLPRDELSGLEFLGWREAAARMLPVDGQILLAALRARVSGTTAQLSDGRHVGPPPPLDRHHVHVRPRAQRHWPWHRGPVPAGLRLQQAWGWLFVPDGRVVVVVDPDDPLPMLPGGTIENSDASPEAALVREAAEEAALSLGAVERIGWSYDATGDAYGGIGACARIRLAGQITAIGPARPDPATGRHLARLLATPQQAAALLGWGDRATARPNRQPFSPTPGGASPSRRPPPSARSPLRESTSPGPPPRPVRAPGRGPNRPTAPRTTWQPRSRKPSSTPTDSRRRRPSVSSPELRRSTTT